MAKTKFTIVKAKPEFAVEGERYRSSGPNSGEELREDFVKPWLKTSHDGIVLDFTGTHSWNYRFIEELLGGLARQGYDISSIDIIGTDDIDLDDFVIQIKGAYCYA